MGPCRSDNQILGSLKFNEKSSLAENLFIIISETEIERLGTSKSAFSTLISRECPYCYLEKLK